MENNWCIRLTNENKDVVVGYFNKRFKVNMSDKYQYYGVVSGVNIGIDILITTEITTEQFIEKIKLEGYNVGFDKSVNKYCFVENPILSTSKNNPSINNDFGVVFGSDNKFHKSDLDLNITPKQIQSDGGSTQYYQIEITNSNGEKFNCELNDILRDVFNNQWDLCNIVKASRRISESRKGQGKKNVSIQYDANKIIWFAEEIKKYSK